MSRPAKRNRISPQHDAELEHAPKVVDTPELALSCVPPEVLNLVRTGNAAILPTRLLNMFYAFADSIEKNIKSLKEKCRPVIIARRDEGEAAGAEKQHREFVYQTPTGEVHLIIQERMIQQPDPQKLEALLKSKNLWDTVLTTSLDMAKVDALCTAGLITTEEFSNVSNAPRATYALVARVSAEGHIV